MLFFVFFWGGGSASYKFSFSNLFVKEKYAERPSQSKRSLSVPTDNHHRVDVLGLPSVVIETDAVMISSVLKTVKDVNDFSPCYWSTFTRETDRQTDKDREKISSRNLTSFQPDRERKTERVSGDKSLGKVVIVERKRPDVEINVKILARSIRTRDIKITICLMAV